MGSVVAGGAVVVGIDSVVVGTGSVVVGTGTVVVGCDAVVVGTEPPGFVVADAQAVRSSTITTIKINKYLFT